MAVIQLSFNKRMMFLMPEILWTGISIAYFSGILVSMMTLSMADNGINDS